MIFHGGESMTNKLGEDLAYFKGIVNEQESYRCQSLNMVAAESLTSTLVENIVGSDFSRRYSSPGVYAGDRVFVHASERTVNLLHELFQAKYINIRPATGNLAVLAVLTGLTKPSDIVMKVDDQHGGYPIRLAEWAGIKIVPFPFDFERLNIRIGETIDQIRKLRPTLIVFGASEFLHPHPVWEIAMAAHEVDAVVAYDGSHVMGLIAGGQFQDPLREGADVLFGSTHKTFPGPQRGMIATNDEKIFERISHVLSPPPFLLSCYHLNTVVALGVAALEMLAFGQQFASQIILNAQALAEGLLENNVQVLTAEQGGTYSHQVILDNGGFVSPLGKSIKTKFENCGILADAVVRIGTQEVTRLGMRETEMKAIARMMADIIHERRNEVEIRADVTALASSFRHIRFSFEASPS
jgi:glycine hydroxymethyltransferase